VGRGGRARNASNLCQRIEKEARDFYEELGLSARDGRPLCERARKWAFLPVVLLAVAYSAFGIVFMVVPAKVVSAR
jgi:hypothetical protein